MERLRAADLATPADLSLKSFLLAPSNFKQWRGDSIDTPEQLAEHLIHLLDPVRAYELGLVKQIGVDSVIELQDANRAYVEVEGFRASARSVSARLAIWVNQTVGPAKKTVTVKNGDDLYALSNKREIYRDGFIVNEIDFSHSALREGWDNPNVFPH